MSWPGWNQQGAMSLNVQTTAMNVGMNQIQQQHLMGQQGNVMPGLAQNNVAGITPLINPALQAGQYGLQNQAVPGAGCTYTPQQWAAIQQQQWQWQWQQQVAGDQAAASKTGYPPLPVQPATQTPSSQPPLPVEPPPPDMAPTPAVTNMDPIAAYQTATNSAYQTGPPQSMVSFSTGVPPPQIAQASPGMYDPAQYAQQAYYIGGQTGNTNNQMYGANSNMYRQQMPHNQNENKSWQQTNNPQIDPQKTKTPNIPSLMSMSLPPPNKNLNLDITKQAGKRTSDVHNAESAESKRLKKELTRQQMDEETEFDIQFQKWEADFNAWREQNANHPDKKAYQEYETKFLACRNKLLERREIMRAKRSSEKTNLDNMMGNVNNTSPPENNYYGSQFEQKWKEEVPQMKPDLSATADDSSNFNSDYQKDSQASVYQMNDNSQMSFLSETSNGDTFLKNTESKGIPGLDLVTDEEKKVENNAFKKADVIEIKDDQEAESEQKSIPKPDLNEAISSGINAILADQKLLSMLSIVTKCQNPSEIGNLLASNKTLYNELSKSVQNTPLAGASTTNPPNSIAINESPIQSNVNPMNSYDRQPYEEPISRHKPALLPTPNIRGFPGDKTPTNFQNRRSNDFNQSQNFPDQSPNNFSQPRPNYLDQGFNHSSNQGLNNLNQPRNFENQNPNNFGPARGCPNRPLDNKMQMDQNDEDFYENDPYGNLDDQTDNPDRQPHLGGNFPIVEGNPPFNSMANTSPQFGNLLPNRNSFGNNRFGNDFNRPDFNQPNFGANNPNMGEANRILPSLMDNKWDPSRNPNFGNESKSNDSNWSGPSNTSFGNEPLMEVPNLFDMTPKQIQELAIRSKLGGDNFNRLMEGNIMEGSSCPPKEKIDGFEPVRVIDYGHKSLPDVIESNVQTFDYGHKTQNFNYDEYAHPDKLPTPPVLNQSLAQSSNSRFGSNRTRPSRFSLPDTQPNPGFGNEPSFPGRRSETRSSLERNRLEKNLSDIDNQDYPCDYHERSRDRSRERSNDYNERNRDRRDSKYNRSDRGSRFERDDDRLGRDRDRDRSSKDNDKFGKDNDRSGKDNDRSGKDNSRSDRDNRFDRDSRYDRDNRYDRDSRFERDNNRSDRDSRADKGNRYEKNSRYDRDSDRPEKDRFGRDRRYEGPNNRVNDKKSEQVKPDANTNRDANIVLIDDILLKPGREHRPPSIVIILRGPPGSGKTHLAKLLKETEQAQGGPAPRILSLDDYFMVEKEVPFEGDGRKNTKTEMQYEYDAEMEQSYRDSLVKSFKKTLTDGFFNFVIVDCINSDPKHYEEMWSFARQNNFQVYVCELEMDVQTCLKRNIHDRLESEIKSMITDWTPTPTHQLRLDVTSLLQSASIIDVEMEDAFEEISDKEDNYEKKNEKTEGDGGDEGGDQDEDDEQENIFRSKWDNADQNDDHLARLDGTSKPLRHQTMEEYLAADWEEPTDNQSGKKRVRWADIEEKRAQDKMRDRGFVVGQTDWDRMMDPTGGQSALTQTKYIERVHKQF